MKRVRTALFWIFLISAAIAIGLILLNRSALETQTLEVLSTTTAEADNSNVAVGLANVSTLISIATALVSLLGLISTTVIDWRREAREGKEAQLELEKMRLEMEKLKLEMEKIRRSDS